MAAVLALPSAGREAILQESRRIYNHLPEAPKQAGISDAQQRELESILSRHQVHDCVGIHLAHRHAPLPDETVSCGTYYETPVASCWIKATPVQDLPLAVHGNSFLLTPHGFHPYDFVAGDSPVDLSQLSHSFLSDLATFLRRENLDSVAALQIIHEHPPMLEIDLPEEGTVMLDSIAIKHSSEFNQDTGWKYGDFRGYTAYETHARKSQHEHIVANGGAPLRTLDDIVNALERQGILKI